MRENLSSGVGEQQRRRPACASAQSDQCLSIHFLESTICDLATGEISIFLLVSAAEETGLKLAFVGIPKDRFCRVKAHMLTSIGLSILKQWNLGDSN